MADVTTYRTYLTTVWQQHPEVFPQALAQGYTFHDCYRSRKQDVRLRRIKLKATGAVFTLRPSFLLPYGDRAHRRGGESALLAPMGSPL